MSDAGIQTGIHAQKSNSCGDGLGVARYNLRSAMREDRAAHTFFAAPCNLGANRAMSDHNFAASAENPPRNRRSIADIDVNPAKRFALISNSNQIRNIEDVASAGRDPISDRWRTNRMFHRKCLEPDAEQVECRSRLDHDFRSDRAGVNPAPRFRSGINGARSACFQARSMVRMRMRNQNRIGIYTLTFAGPIRAAIDHYRFAAPGNQQRGVHSMQRCSCLDFSSSSQKRQFHAPIS